MRRGQIKLFEGDSPEKVFADANAFMAEKNTCVAQTHITPIEPSQIWYSVIVFYDI